MLTLTGKEIKDLAEAAGWRKKARKDECYGHKQITPEGTGSSNKGWY